MLDFAEKKRKIFASYHFTSLDLKFNGFGNYVGEFDVESYKDDPGKFILDLEKSVSMAVSEKLKMEVTVKVLYFR